MHRISFLLIISNCQLSIGNCQLESDFLPVFIQEIVLKDMERLDFLDVYPLVILPSPFSCDGA